MSGVGVLEIMWFGSRSQVLRDRLSDVRAPSLDVLRTSAMFEAVFWTRTTYGQVENSEFYAVAPMCDPETYSRGSGSLGLSGSGMWSEREFGHRLTYSCNRVRKSPFEWGV